MTIRRDKRITPTLVEAIKNCYVKPLTLLEPMNFTGSEEREKWTRMLYSGLGVSKHLLFGKHSSCPTTDIVDATVKHLMSIEASKFAELFNPDNKAVLKGRILQDKSMIRRQVGEEGASYILGRVGQGMSRMRVEIAENFVGEEYYKFLFDGEDLFGDRV